MAFVVSHMNQGIKAAKPNLLLLLCHSVAVHTVIPAAGRRQLLFFSSSFLFSFFFPNCCISPYKCGGEWDCLGESCLCPCIFLPHLPSWARRKGKFLEQRGQGLIQCVPPITLLMGTARSVWMQEQGAIPNPGAHVGSELCWCNALQGYLALKEHGCCVASKVPSRTHS